MEENQKPQQESENTPQDAAGEPPQPIPLDSPELVTITPSPTIPSDPSGQTPQHPMSASQLDTNQPKNSLNVKKLLVKIGLVLVLLGAIFAGLVLTNVVALSEFKTINYTDTEGTHYKVSFYTKHGSKQLRSGNTQLVSKVSKGGKFPLALSMISSDEGHSYSRVKGCAGFVKIFDVQNSNLDQTISICRMSGTPQTGEDTDNLVYVAGFVHNGQAHIITLSQDLSSINLASPHKAEEALTKFGMEPYKEDIEKIVSSISME